MNKKNENAVPYEMNKNGPTFVSALTGAFEKLVLQTWNSWRFNLSAASSPIRTYKHQLGDQDDASQKYLSLQTMR